MYIQETAFNRRKPDRTAATRKNDCSTNILGNKANKRNERFFALPHSME